MTLVAWRFGLPAEGSFQEQSRPQAIEFQTEVGPGKRRRRSTLITVPTTFRLPPKTAAVKADFDYFHDDELAGGSLRFEMDYPDGSSGDVRTWRFVEPPTYQDIADYWVIGVSLIRLD